MAWSRCLPGMRGKLERGETVTRGESLIDLNTGTADLVEEEDEKS